MQRGADGAGEKRVFREMKNPRPVVRTGVCSGAGNGIRTRDVDLGKVALYH